MTDYFAKKYRKNSADFHREMFIYEWNSGTPAKEVASIFSIKPETKVYYISRALAKHGYNIRRRQKERRAKNED